MAGHLFLMGTGSGAMCVHHYSSAPRVQTRQVISLFVSYRGITLFWLLYFSCSLSVGRCRNSPRPPGQPAGALCVGGSRRLVRS